MTEKELISVIVPVYKVEAYLDKCVQSIVDQTYRNLEIILVDDGSPDRCGAMCDAWAAKDDRIKVIHQKNAGGGPARNAGFEIARGTLVGLIDSDDYIAPDMYEKLSALMTDEVDIVECELVETHDDHAVFTPGHCSPVYPVAEAMRLHICDTLFRQTPPNKLYRRSVIADVRFPAGTGIDDEYWTYRVIGNARNLIHTSSVLYAYRQQENSVMHSLTIPKRLRAIDAKTQRHTYISTQFPELVSLCRKELWFSCLYQGQLILRTFPASESAQAVDYLRGVLREHPARRCADSVKERIWLTLARLSFVHTCRLRNFLKIGI